MHLPIRMFRWIAVVALAAAVAVPTGAWAEDGRGGHHSDDTVAHQADDTSAQVGDDQGTDDRAAPR